MRFMNLIKSTENAGSPPKALLDAIAKFGQEATATGWLVSAGGLFPSAMGARVRLSTGKLTISDGPFYRIQGVDRRLRHTQSDVGARSGRTSVPIPAALQGALAGLERFVRCSIRFPKANPANGFKW
jgi:hypothetical protein